MKLGRTTAYFHGEANIRLRSFSRLLVLRRLEVRPDGVCACRQKRHRGASDRDGLYLVELRNEVIER